MPACSKLRKKIAGETRGEKTLTGAKAWNARVQPVGDQIPLLSEAEVRETGLGTRVVLAKEGGALRAQSVAWRVLAQSGCETARDCIQGGS